MNKFLKIFIVVYAVIFAVYFFFIDTLFKVQIEREGSRALQAPLAIGKVTFHLIPTSLTLRDVRLGNARVPARNLIEADALSLPLSLRDLFSRKFIIDSVDVHGVRFNRARSGASTNAAATSATQSPQLREALQRIQQTLNHPLSSNTVDPNASLTGAMLGEQFKPLLAQIATALGALATPANNLGDWQILVRRVNIDGVFDFGVDAAAGGNALRFAGGIDNLTPQPQLFDTVMTFDVRSEDGQSATLRANGSVDNRKLAQASLRFDLNNFQVAQWPLSSDPELKIVVANAVADVQALLSLTGNQFDFNAIAHFREARFDIANGANEVERVTADVWRRADTFDINLQASGALADPVLKLNSSLDVPLANAIRQLQSAPAAANPFTPTP